MRCIVPLPHLNTPNPTKIKNIICIMQNIVDIKA